MKRALIAGAGNAGLFLALLLTRQGWAVHVLEKGTQLRDGGGAILLWPNATSLLERAGVEVPGATIRGLELRRWDGRSLRQLPVQDRRGGHSRVVWRGDLLRALYHRLPPDIVEFGRSLPAFEQRPEGVEVEGLGPFDLLVGADGIHSAVRQRLKGVEPVRSAGVTAWVGASDGAFGPPG
ncbi:MAG TPA: FAD-dependent monooxygenase, partial [Myxococcota bacterium]|nr:FAD-dependent monooxygenase [Myxococcota bacterium]